MRLQKTELWRSALFGLLVALALEQVLAWRAAHHGPGAEREGEAA